MKISTKLGDNGETSMFRGKRVSKASRYMIVLGELDELHSVVGWAKFGVGAERFEEIRVLLERFQDDLYRMMSVIGYEMKVPESIEGVAEADVYYLEELVNKYEEMVGELSKFIRTGSTEAAARLHLARTECRRAERMMVGFNEAEKNKELQIPGSIMRYMNRLSDLLFLLAYSFETR